MSINGIPYIIPMEYIQIDHKNSIEVIEQNVYINEVSSFLNIINNEGTLGKEINKFFQILVPESKEDDTFKMLSSMASKSKSDKEISENAINKIMNLPENNVFVLSKDICELLAVIMRESFKKLKKKKIKSFKELMDIIVKVKSEERDVLLNYKTANNINNNAKNQKKSSKTSKNPSSTKHINQLSFAGQTGLNLMKMDKKINFGKSLIMGLDTEEQLDLDFCYKFKTLASDKREPIPIEMIILIQKFKKIRKLILNIDRSVKSNNTEDNLNAGNSSNSSSDSIFSQSDILNYIFVLSNIEWLFSDLLELEVDLSNDNLTTSLIKAHRNNLKRFAKLINKEVKLTTLRREDNIINKNNFYTFQNTSYFNETSHSNDLYSSSMSSNNFSLSLLNQSSNNPNASINFLLPEDNSKSHIEDVIKQYQNVFNLIIIYGYYTGKMSKITNIKLITELSIWDEITEMLKKQKLIINDFHFISFLNHNEITSTSIEFNALDNQSFEKVILYLNRNQNLTSCELSLFPSEKYFKPEFLLKMLKSCNENYKVKKNKFDVYYVNTNVLMDIDKNEDLDSLILRRLSKFFVKNLTDLFYLLTIRTNIEELFLHFNIPTILRRNGYYIKIILKFFINIFIFIDKAMNNLKKLEIIAENFIIDSKIHPYLIDFFENLTFYKRENNLINLSFKAKFYNINNLNRLVSYNLKSISLGELDLISYNSVIDHLTSVDFIDSKLMKINLGINNSIINISQIYNNLIKLYTRYSNNVIEINVFTRLDINYNDLVNLLNKTNYNTLSSILLEFNINSLKKDPILEKEIEQGKGSDFVVSDNLVELNRIIRKWKVHNRITNLMLNLSQKNKKFIDYNIYKVFERYFYQRLKKKVVIYFK